MKKSFAITVLSLALFCVVPSAFTADPDDLVVQGGKGGLNPEDGKVTDGDLGKKFEGKAGTPDDLTVPGAGGTLTYLSKQIITAMGNGMPATGENPGSGAGGGAAAWNTTADTMSATYKNMRITGGDTGANQGGGGDAMVAIWESSVRILDNVYITSGSGTALPAGNADLILDGGTLAVGGQIITENKNPLTSHATFEMKGGTMEIVSGYNGENNEWRDVANNEKGGEVKITGSDAKYFVVHGGNYATLNKEVQGGGDFFKDGNGSLALNQDNKSMGKINVRGGLLQIGAAKEKDKGKGTIGEKKGDADFYTFDKDIQIGDDAHLVFDHHAYKLSGTDKDDKKLTIAIGDRSSMVFQNSRRDDGGDNTIDRNVTLGSDAGLRFEKTNNNTIAGQLELGDGANVLFKNTGANTVQEEVTLGHGASMVFEETEGNNVAKKDFTLENDAEVVFRNTKNSQYTNTVEGKTTLGRDARLLFENTAGDNFVKGDVELASGARLEFDAAVVTNTVSGVVSGSGDVFAQGQNGKTILTQDNTYSGRTVVGEGHTLELQGLLGTKTDNIIHVVRDEDGNADGIWNVNIGVYDGDIELDGTLVFNRPAESNPALDDPYNEKAKAATRIQQLNGQITGKGSLHQLSDNRLILTGASDIGGNVVIGKAFDPDDPQSVLARSELEVAVGASFHADGGLTVNAVGLPSAPSPDNLDRDVYANLTTAVGHSAANRGYLAPGLYSSNTTFGDVVDFVSSEAVWSVDLSQVRDGDNPGLLLFIDNRDAAKQFSDVDKANDALRNGNTMYFYTLEAKNEIGVAGWLNVERNEKVQVSDVFVNSLLLHNSDAVRTAVADRIDHAMYRMSLEGKTRSCDQAKTHWLSGNSIWANYVGRSNKIRSSYAELRHISEDPQGPDVTNDFRWSSNGTQIGFDILASKRFVLGTLFAYEQHNGRIHPEAHALADRVKSNDYSIGLYGGYCFDNGFDLRGSLGFGMQDYKVQRYQSLGLNPGVYHSSSKGNTIEASFEIGRRFYCCNCKHHCDCRLSFRPVIGFDYYNNRIDGARENRGGTYGLSYDSTQLDQMAVRIGTDVQRYWKFLRMDAGVYYSYVMNKDGDLLSVRTTDGWHGGDAVGSDLGHQTLTLHFGGNWFLDDDRNKSFFASYEGDYYADRAGSPFGHNGVVGFQCRF